MKGKNRIHYIVSVTFGITLYLCVLGRNIGVTLEIQNADSNECSFWGFVARHPDTSLYTETSKGMH